jgi:hypothetical protein
MHTAYFRRTRVVVRGRTTYVDVISNFPEPRARGAVSESPWVARSSDVLPKRVASSRS